MLCLHTLKRTASGSSHCPRVALTRFRLQLHLASRSRSVPFRFIIFAAFGPYVDRALKCKRPSWVGKVSSARGLNGALKSIRSSPSQLWRSLERSSACVTVGCSGSLQGKVVPSSCVTTLGVTPAPRFRTHLHVTADASAKRTKDSLQGAGERWNAGHVGDSVTVGRYPLVYRYLGANQGRERLLGGAGLHRLRSKTNLRRCSKQPITLHGCLCGLLLRPFTPAAASSKGTLARTGGDRMSI
jgi:hypothetical protein